MAYQEEKGREITWGPTAVLSLGASGEGVRVPVTTGGGVGIVGIHLGSWSCAYSYDSTTDTVTRAEEGLEHKDRKVRVRVNVPAKVG